MTAAVTDTRRGEDLLDSAALRGGLVEALAADGRRLIDCRAELRRASRSRPVVAFTLSWTAADGTLGSGVVIGKGYRRGGGPEAYETMTRLWTGRFGTDPLLTIPQPVGWVPDPPVLLQAPAPDETLHDHLIKPDGGLAEVRASAHWLTALHAMRLPGMAVWSVADDVEKLRRYADGVAIALPVTAPRVSAIFATTAESLELQAPATAVPTHGDFQPKNIHLGAAGSVTVIDFDRCAIGDPGRDLGHFLGQAFTMSHAKTGSFDRIRPWGAAFLTGYAEHAEVPLLGPHLARTIVEVLYYRLVVKPVRDAWFVREWLDVAEEALAGRWPR